ncbi:MAG: histidine kinase, partial [Oscillospiraceae bacterium]|nr:histidine kinase [Oscillospiraceae bacterium]
SSPDAGRLGQNLLEDDRLREAVLCTKAGYECFSDEIVLYAPVNNGRWVLVERVDLREYLHPVHAMWNVMLFTTLGVAVLAVVVSNFLAAGLSRPIFTLSQHMNEVREGKFSRDRTAYHVRELLDLRDNFNLMQDNIEALMEQIQREEQSKRMLELSVLQAQITPHFLYNSLYSIRCMVSMQNHAEGTRMLDALISLLHRSVGNTEETTDVEEELRYLEDYITLRRMGFKKPFSVRMEADPRCLKRRIPRMLLQPLVENAVNHGIRPAAGRDCTLSVGVRLEGGEMVFEVSDDGVGMSEERLFSVLSREDGAAEGSWNRVGLFNVNERLLLHYGSRSLLQIYSEEQVGTTILFRIPVQEREEESPDEGADRGR